MSMRHTDVWMTKSLEKEKIFLSQNMQQGETSLQVGQI